MIKISNLRLSASESANGLRAAAAGLLGIPASSILSTTILKRSVDARRKSGVNFVYTLALSSDMEAEILQANKENVSLYTPEKPYIFPYAGLSADMRPVVVGMGPAGLFAALCLAEAGLRPLVLERGQPVETRTVDVERFWKTGALNTCSNVQFGEGGAGTFSDGKLTTGVNDDRIRFVLQKLIAFGAPEDILYLSKPHIGTDKLRRVVAAMRRELIRLGCDIRFGHKLDNLSFENGCLKEIGVTTDDGAYSIDLRQLILAPGNSARDTFEILKRCGVRLSPKSFSVGVRIEHLQKSVDAAQYGQAATLGTLPASDYKLAVHLDNGRSVYTFCVCPGGSVIAASSEIGQVVTNGMSAYARNETNCNGGLLVSVTPEDYPGDALAGIRFQQALERSAFTHGGGDYKAPAQRVSDFLTQRPSVKKGAVSSSYRPGVTWCNLWDVLPPFVCQAIAKALPLMEKSIRGFSHPDAVLTAVETRSSSPVRIDREMYQAAGLKGLYPCGEGAGYAGGIMSAAVDGIRAAEALCAALN